MELIADGLHFPTGLAFDDEGSVYVSESGLPLAGQPAGGRIWRLHPDGTRDCLKRGLRPPVNDITWYQDALYIAEGGKPGRISRLYPNGRWEGLVDDLPGGGNYHTNTAAFGPDGKLYFGQGAMTNSGIVGPDAYALPWLQTLPHPYDLPGYSVTLAGVNIETEHPLEEKSGVAVTGAFVPFGQRGEAGTRLEPCLPCTAAVMRCQPDGTELELVAWGLRNPYGLCFLPGGRLLALDLGINDRGSRPVGNVPDCLFEVKMGRWYGWPDFAAGKAVTDSTYVPQRGPAPSMLLANHDELPPPEQPLLAFPLHAAPTKMAVAPSGTPHAGQLHVTLFGDKLPFTGPPGPQTGRAVVRLDPNDWSIHPLDHSTLARPIDLAFHPWDKSLYVLDFGEYEMSSQSDLAARSGSGMLCRIGP
ncbi:sugar dehydrogenase [Candidatus Entotheonella serta]|nr:sugar dehydrogenase [Candidatus Entotheonella serta]